MNKKIITFLVLVGVCIIDVFAIYLHHNLKYTHGRKGIYNTFRGVVEKAELKKIFKNFNNDKNFLWSLDSSNFTTRYGKKTEECYGYAEKCIVFKSVENYRGRKDIFIYYLKDGELQYKVIQYLVAPSFAEWMKLLFKGMSISSDF